ncbi:MAG: hypothetical protein J2P37_01605 [Ktedonobacteraceae bacterium]|nr:hypothetical protein [Ktedonobacteraceae bacterium]MBO0795215.1 hypothetical protein [Ktedonobacteraceae bacterium]
MYRTLEAIFRHPIQLLVLIVLLPFIGVGIGFFLPRTYETTATLWALRRYESIGASGPESNLQATPAETQVTALLDLLQTRTFDLTVANAATNLADSLNLSDSVRSDPHQLEDALVDEIFHNVKVAAQGYNLYVISYQNPNSQVAQQIVAAVINTYGLQSAGFSTFEGQRLLEAYETQLKQAQQDLKNATAAETNYIQLHPNSTHTDTVNDPQYISLHNQTQVAQARVQTIQTNIDNVNQQLTTLGTGADSLYKIVDQPLSAKTPVSRVKTLLTAGGIGLGVAIVACGIYIALLVRRDRTMRHAAHLQKAVALPVIMQVPHFELDTEQVLVERLTV